jgi:hypothetical protein
MSEKKRIQLPRTVFLSGVAEIKQTPDFLVKELGEAPLNLLLAKSFVRPVAFDKDPYYVPQFLANKGGKQGKTFHKNQDKNAQDSMSDSDSDFETVEQKKRYVGAIKQSKI